MRLKLHKEKLCTNSLLKRKKVGRMEYTTEVIQTKNREKCDPASDPDARRKETADAEPAYCNGALRESNAGSPERNGHSMIRVDTYGYILCDRQRKQDRKNRKNKKDQGFSETLEAEVKKLEENET